MKKLLFALLVLSFTIASSQYTYISDDNFEKYLIDEGYDNVLDNYVLTSNIKGIKTLDLSYKNINNLSGIYAFTALESLNISNNSINYLSIDRLLNLETLIVDNNPLNVPYLSKNSKLKIFSALGVEISKFYTFTENLLLEELYLDSEKIIEIDVSKNQQLHTLVIKNTKITSLDLTNNFALKNLISNSNGALLCIKVLDAESSMEEVGFLIDSYTQFAEDCIGLSIIDQITGLQEVTNDNGTLYYHDLPNEEFNKLYWLKNPEEQDYTKYPFLLPESQLTVKTEGDKIGSVEFRITNAYWCCADQPTTRVIIDNDPPFTVDTFEAGYNGEGWVSINATPYGEDNAQGIIGNQYGLRFRTLNYYREFKSTLNIRNLADNSLIYEIKEGQDNNLDINLTEGQVIFFEPQNKNDQTSGTPYNYTITGPNVNEESNYFIFGYPIPSPNGIKLIEGTYNINLGWYYSDGYLVTGLDKEFTFTVTNSEEPKTYVPDDSFEQELIDEGYDDVLDNYVITENISTVTELFLSPAIFNHVRVQDLTGLQDFIALKTLSVPDSPISQIDVSKNKELEVLLLGGANITLLDISNNSKLIELDINGNELTELDISKNLNLKRLELADTEIGILDVTANSLLERLNIFNTPISSLDVEKNLNLNSLNASMTQLTALDVSTNNTLTTLNAENNPQLSCVQVSENQLNTTPINWTKDDLATYSLDCSETGEAARTYIPDDNFEQYLIEQEYDDVLDDYVLTENISTIEYVDLAYKRVRDLTGLEDFSALKHLGTNWSPIDAIDISQNKKLELLSIRGTWLTSIDLSNNTALKHLEITESNISTLDLSANVELEVLLANQLGNISLGFLSELNVSKNYKLKKLKVENNPELGCIQVSENQLSNIPIDWLKDDLAEYSLDCSETNEIGKTYVPDNNFEQALIDLGHDDVLDDYVSTENVITITQLELLGKGIQDLTGLQDFLALKSLDLADNPIDKIDVSANVELQILLLGNTEVAVLDVSKNKALIELDLNGSEISTIDISNNPNLERLEIAHTNVHTIDLSANSSLEKLNIFNTSIASLDMEKNILLEFLNASATQFTTLDVSKNNLLTTFTSSNSTQLSCIKVNENQLNAIPQNWTKAAAAEYALDCSATTNEEFKTFVPDNNFEQALIDLGYDNVLDNYVVTENIATITRLALLGKGIQDLTGLQDFIALKSLDVADNPINKIDVSANTALQILLLGNTKVANLNVTNNSELLELDANGTQITLLDLYSNAKLQRLEIADSKIATLDVFANTSLEKLNIFNTAITNLYLEENRILSYLNASATQLRTLDVSKNNSLNTFIAANSLQLSCIQVSESQLKAIPQNWTKEGAAQYSIDCSTISDEGLRTFVPDNNFEQALIDLGYDDVLDDYVLTKNISEVRELHVLGKGIQNITGLQDFSVLTFLDAADNPINQINVTANAELEILLLGATGLTGLNVSKNIALRELDLNGTPITALNVTKNTNLERLEIADGGIIAIDVSENTALEKLNIFNTAITNLDLENNLALQFLNVNASHLIALNLSENAALTTIDATNTPQLACIQVSENQMNEIPENWTKDDSSQYSLDCSEATVADEDSNNNGSDDTDGVAEEEEEEEEIVDNLSLFPTFTEGIITIQNNMLHEIGDVSVRSLNGISARYMLINSNPEEIQVDLRGKAKGMYIVQIQRVSGEVDLIKIMLH